jgi:hypothetical protein
MFTIRIIPAVEEVFDGGICEATVRRQIQSGKEVGAI